MSQEARRQQQADAPRSGTLSGGKLDTDTKSRRAPPGRPPVAPSLVTRDVDLQNLHDRVRKDYDESVRGMRNLGIVPDIDDAESHENGAPVVEAGDTARANQEKDVSFATRQRVFERVNRLALALERIESGAYGSCSICDQPIEPARLAVMPEADTCLRCQEELEHSPGRQIA
jgi:RNA polymerase-binding transcription factor DksA